jgi:hypothetical protein
MDGAGDLDGRRPQASARPIDPGAGEGELEAAGRRDGFAAGRRAELEPDAAGAPAGVEALQLAGELEQHGGARRDRAASMRVGRLEPRWAALTEAAPDLAGGAVGDAEVGGDGRERVALLMTADDLPADRKRDGSGHVTRLRGPGMGNHQPIKLDVTHVHAQGNNLPAHRSRQPYCA